MTEKPRYPRSTCAVMGCVSWSRRFPGPWMCGKHWPKLPRRVRAANRAAWRKRDAAWAAHRAVQDKAHYLAARRADRQVDRLWDVAVRCATLRAAGL